MVTGTGRTQQATLKETVRFAGVGVHSGINTTLSVGPADAGTGIVFSRSDLGAGGPDIPASFRQVGATDHCTTLVAGKVSIATVEHLLASLSAMEIDNAHVEVSGPEVPVLDGSSVVFMEALEQVGIVTQPVPRSFIRILRPVRVELGSSFAELRPHPGRRFEIEIDYPNPIVGRQRFAADVTPSFFRREMAAARTFGFLNEVEDLWRRGFALGASLENALVIGDGKIINPEGLRFADEFARHKAVDALGDLALAGAPIIGCFRSYRGGHAVNARLLAALFAAPDAFERIEAPVGRNGRLGDFAAAVMEPDLT